MSSFFPRVCSVYIYERNPDVIELWWREGREGRRRRKEIKTKLHRNRSNKTRGVQIEES